MTTTHADRTLVVAIPVSDLARSRAFFADLGFAFDAAFSDDTAALMLVGEHASIMLLTRETFAQHSHRPTGDPATHALALYTFGVTSREEVDRLSAAALSAGGEEADGAEDHGFMYARSFFDLDGHGWQVMWMDPAGPPQQQDDVAASA